MPGQVLQPTCQPGGIAACEPPGGQQQLVAGADDPGDHVEPVFLRTPDLDSHFISGLAGADSHVLHARLAKHLEPLLEGQRRPPGVTDEFQLDAAGGLKRRRRPGKQHQHHRRNHDPTNLH